ncbi:uncharacterized protein LOC122501414 [Leptopilina heterotoma]|uniref:uncharacterized protein LOC122501414 n=1 Tax=Leptopilina heterotoma TaxID=63436 RepID=UPI001CA7F96F|nr:uncharacterized protein LOC122501414 [Leptopilina heterotoma]
MIRLAIICLLNLLVNSDNINDKLSLMKLYSSLHEAEKYMENQSMNEDSAIFFGNTKSGRSTLINYLMGNKLEVKRSSRVGLKITRKAGNESTGPEISEGSLSTTIIPKGWTSKIFPNLTLWDVPGFGENRGTIQDVIHSFLIYRLVKSVKSLKIILVDDIKDIVQDNPEQFLSLLERIEILFGDQFKDSFKSTSVIFTKVPGTVNGVLINKNYIKYHLETHFLLNPDFELSEDSKNFAMFLLNNTDRFALFKGISFITNVTADIDADIISVLKNSERIQSNLLQDIHPSISASSMLRLLQAKEIKELEEMIPMLVDVLKEALFNETEKIKFLQNKSDKIELNNTKFKLIEIKQKLSTLLYKGSSLNETIETIFSIYSKNLSSFDKEKVMINLKLIKSVESVLHIIISNSLKRYVDYIILEFILNLSSTISYVEIALIKISSVVDINETKSNENATDSTLDNSTTYQINSMEVTEDGLTTQAEI